MAIREVDAISDAIIATEKEIAGEAWGNEDTDAAEASGDRSLEDIGDGLEGQHEAAAHVDEGEDAGDNGEAGDEGDDVGEGEGQTEAEAASAAAVAARPAGEQPQGRIPSGRLREANERARAAEAERDAVKGQLTTFSEKLDQALRRIDDLSRAPVRAEPPKAAEPPAPAKVPDIFEDGSEALVNHLTGLIDNRLSTLGQTLETNRVETSMAIAHATHKGAFEAAYEAINKLDPRNPDDRATVQRIYKSPNPGDALVNWHKRSQTLAEVGDDPAAYRERVAKETREALMKDPEFRKALVAEMRGEAGQGDNGSPRTQTRLPGSLRRAAGSNLGAERHDHREADDSEQAVADAAWR
ncbi:MAG: hypothetical protein PS018_20320 [bacterium]|nr:hypothetical protein [bacterium]